MNPAFRRAVLRWYRREKRDLPWRGERDPYRIWVSETMLQQTQVATVIPYYRRFVRRFPTAQALARAPLDRVLKAWEGLGYYRRARNLHAGARFIVRRCGGKFPRTYDEARRVPGVGDYTAGAVLSIAFGVPLPALDANAKRVFARVLAEKNTASVRLRVAAAALVPATNAGEWTQAVMELGALVCLPRNPKCGACPVARFCAAKASGNPESYPAKVRARAPKAVRAAVLVVEDGRGRIFLRKAEREFLGGLWEFPWKETRHLPTPASARAFARRAFRLAADPGKEIAAFTQIYSHRKIAMRVFRFRAASRRASLSGWWMTPEQARRLAMGAAHRKIWAAVRAARG